MAVISVEVPDRIAKKLASRKHISIDNLYDADEDTIVDFWKNWVWKEEFEKYLSNK